MSQNAQGNGTENMIEPTSKIQHEQEVIIDRFNNIFNPKDENEGKNDKKRNSRRFSSRPKELISLWVYEL